MTTLNYANTIKLGTITVSKIYMAGVQAWPPQPMGLYGSLANVIAGSAYSSTLTITGSFAGTVTVTSSVGSIPSWLTVTVSGSTILFAGTAPSTAQTDNFTVHIQDSSATPQVATSAQTIVVSPASVTYVTWDPTTAGYGHRVVSSNLGADFNDGESGGGGIMIPSASCFNLATASAYWEVTIVAANADNSLKIGFGVYGYGSNSPGSQYADPPTNWGVNPAGDVFQSSSGSALKTGLSYKAGDIVMIALIAGSFWIGVNGTWYGNPSAGTGAVFTGLTGIVGPAVGCGGSNLQQVLANFGASAWAYTPPTGTSGISA